MNKMTMSFIEYVKYIQDKGIHNVAFTGGSRYSIIDINRLKDSEFCTSKVEQFSKDTFTAYLYHEGCADGITAVLMHASLAKLKQEFNIEEDDPIYNSSLYVPVNYGQEPPELPSTVTEIVVFDFSFDEQALLDAYPNVSIISQYDHHKTASERAHARYGCVGCNRLTHSKFNLSSQHSETLPSGDFLMRTMFVTPPDNDGTIVYDSAVDVISLYNNNTKSGASLALLAMISEYFPKIFEGIQLAYNSCLENEMMVSALQIHDHVSGLHTYENPNQKLLPLKPMFPYGNRHAERLVIKNVLLDIIKMAMYAEDRDLWIFAFGDLSKAYNMWLMDTVRSHNDGALSVFGAIVDHVVAYDYEDLETDHVSLDSFLDTYVKIVKYDDNRKKSTAKGAEKIIDSDGRVAYICSYTGKDASDVASIVLDQKEDAQYVMMYSASSKEVYWAVRSRNGLAKTIAEQNGGGGHDNAAGFRSKIDKLLDIYTKVVKE